MDKVEDKTDQTKVNGDFQDLRHPHFKGLEDPRVSESDLTLWEQNPPVAEINSKESEKGDDKDSRFKAKASQCISVTIIVACLVVVWCLFIIPQLCYSKVGICNNVLEPLEAPRTEVSIQNCSSYAYTGSECRGYFGSTCVNPLVNVLATNTSLENDISSLFQVLDNTQILKGRCSEEKGLIKEFVCTYSYQPCDVNDLAILPPRNVCEYLRDSACSMEWTFLLSGQYARLLPSCDVLPENKTTNNCSVNLETSVVMPTTSDDSTDSVTNTPNSDGACARVKYEGTQCSSYLDPCLVDTYESSADGLITQVVDLLESPIVSETCKNNKELVLEFLCHSNFPRCDDINSTVIHLPNRSHCEYIRDTLCSSEWTAAQSFGLPNCSELPTVSTEPICHADATDSPTTAISPLNGSTGVSLTCNEADGFYLYIDYEDENSTINNSCQARCSEWSFFANPAITLLEDLIILIGAIIGCIGAIAVLVFSFIRSKRMLVFPSIFLVYGMVHVLILVTAIIVQYTSRKALSCSSDDVVLNTWGNPTVFCSISGFILLHSLLGLGFWWFAHICAIFWKIMFPLHAKSQEENSKYIHAVAIVLGLVLPLITPCLAFVWDGYSVNRLPPLLCLPINRDVTFYGLLWPLNLIITLGMTQIIFVLNAIRQKSRLFRFRVSKTHRFGISTAEKKLLVIFIYYLLLGYIDIIAFSYTLQSTDLVRHYIEENFACEAYKADPDFVCPRRFLEVRITSGLTLTTYVLLAIYPLINLVFAVNKSEVKVKLVTWFPSVFTESYRASTLSTSIVNTPDTPFTLRRRLTYNFSTTDHIKPSNEMNTIGRSGFYLKKSDSSGFIADDSTKKTNSNDSATEVV